MIDKKDNAPDTIALAADIVAAYVGNHAVHSGEWAALIDRVHAALRKIAEGSVEAPVAPLSPAVPVKKSVTPDFIVCLEDGKKFKSLKRHLRTRYDMSPAQYREKWGLPSDYPMTAPNYAATRSELAKRIGLGEKRNGPEEAEAGMMTDEGSSATPDLRPPLRIGRSDHERLMKLADVVLETLPEIGEFLLGASERALVVDDENIGSDVVRMGSEVTFHEGRSDQTRTIRLVYPEDADISLNKVSVLTPIGAALIGLSVGQAITFSPPAGVRREIMVVAVSA